MRRSRSNRASFVRRQRTFVVAFALSCVLGLLMGTVYASTIVVGNSVVYDKSHTINPLTELLPSVCSSVVGLVDVNSGATYGTTGVGNSDLYLRNAGGGTTINGKGGNDCFVPGALASGILTIKGGAGGPDTCYDGPGPGTYSRTGCENLPSSPYTSATTSSPSGL